METYLKEKLKVDMDLLKMFAVIILILGGGIISIFLTNQFILNIYELFLVIFGCILIVVFFIAAVKRYINIHKNLNKLKNS
ncbi:MAG: hypothetical protein FVQ77_02595 [Cytophagales bacterium]|nr:hypothetical protein [Cytophagales bacterium]